MRDPYEKRKYDMTVCRIKRSNNFTHVSNKIINNKDISWKAKGIMVYALSKPDGWHFNVEDIVAHGTDRITAIYSGLKELMKHGYVVFEREKREGKYEKGIYQFYEDPIESMTYKNSHTSENPHVENLSVDHNEYGTCPAPPDAENPRVENLSVAHIGSNTEIKNTPKGVYKADALLSSHSLRLVHLFISLMRRFTDPKFPDPNIKQWSKDITLMITRDKRKPEEIEEILLWVKEFSYWSPNICSPKKLREKFSTLWGTKKAEDQNAVSKQKQQKSKPSSNTQHSRLDPEKEKRIQETTRLAEERMEYERQKAKESYDQ